MFLVLKIADYFGKDELGNKDKNKQFEGVQEPESITIYIVLADPVNFVSPTI